MAEITLTAEPRTEFGKGAARRIRRADKIPAVLYGHGTDPVHVTLPGHETLLALRQANALLNLVLADGNSQLALPKQVQRDPIKGFIEHVDLVIVRRGEKVTVEVPILLVGEPVEDAVLNQDRTVLSVEAPATAIPQAIEVSIAGLPLGSLITAGDIALPEGVSLAEDADILIASIAHGTTEAELEAELGVTEAAEAPEDEEAPEAE